MTPEDQGWLPTQAPPLYSQDGKGYRATVHAHYFLGESHWMVTEYDPQEGIAFGWAVLNGDRQNAELGYVSMTELATVQAPSRLILDGKELTFSTPVEREDPWTPAPLEECLTMLDQRSGR